MQHDRFGNLIADGMNRAECRHRFLRNQSNFSSADCTNLFAVFFHFDQVKVFIRIISFLEQNVAFNDSSGFFDNSQDRFHGNGFSAPGFSDNADHFPFVSIKRDAIHGFDCPFVQIKINFQISYR